MARELHRFGVTVPAGTQKNAPQLTNLSMPPREVIELQVIVPPGPRGEVGFAIGYGGNPVIPYEPNAFFVTDNEKIYWPLHDHITSGAWQCFAYNTGQFAHTLEIRFVCELATLAAPLSPALLPLGALSGP